MLTCWWSWNKDDHSGQDTRGWRGPVKSFGRSQRSQLSQTSFYLKQMLIKINLVWKVNQTESQRHCLLTCVTGPLPHVLCSLEMRLCVSFSDGDGSARRLQSLLGMLSGDLSVLHRDRAHRNKREQWLGNRAVDRTHLSAKTVYSAISRDVPCLKTRNRHGEMTLTFLKGSRCCVMMGPGDCAGYWVQRRSSEKYNWWESHLDDLGRV